MARLRKLFIHGMLHELTFRTECGLPFPANPLIKYAVESIIARAQELYGVRICGYELMPNHFHFQIVVENPETTPLFVGYIKRETAHMANRLLGRRRRTVWLEGYDSPPILDFEKAIDRFIYGYTNPSKADLEDTIDLYPNTTSWDAFLKGGDELVRNHIPRDLYPQLSVDRISIEEQEALLAKIIEESHCEHSLVIEPDLWLECFPETKGANPEKFKKRIIDGVRAAEDHYRQSRTLPVKGAEALQLDTIDTDYEPKKWGTKTICLSSVVKLRKKFIKLFRYMSDIADSVSANSRVADYASLFPPGFFSPGGKLTSNLNPSLIFS